MKLFKRKLKQYTIKDGKNNTITVQAHRMESYLRQGVSAFVFFKKWRLIKQFLTTNYPLHVNVKTLNK